VIGGLWYHLSCIHFQVLDMASILDFKEIFKNQQAHSAMIG
jgi:hypothetical protein